MGTGHASHDIIMGQDSGQKMGTGYQTNMKPARGGRPAAVRLRSGKAPRFPFPFQKRRHAAKPF